MYILLVRLEEGGGVLKEYPLYTCENVDNYGRPLSFTGSTLIHVDSYTAIIVSHAQVRQYTRLQPHTVEVNASLGKRSATSVLFNPCNSVI